MRPSLPELERLPPARNSMFLRRRSSTAKSSATPIESKGLPSGPLAARNEGGGFNLRPDSVAPAPLMTL